MDDIFYIDPECESVKTYSDLFQDISLIVSYTPYCKSFSFYEVFKHIIHSLVLGKEIILLDADFSNEEIVKLTGDISVTDMHESINPCVLSGFDDFKRFVEENKKRWKITIFTSGTTGLPKKVSHSFDSITRSVKTDKKHLDDIWGFAYNPTHMAGLQVFFQAFLNHNTIIRLFRLEREIFFQALKKYNFTHLSATPTFYRLLLPVEQSFNSLQRLTSGGEKFDPHTLEQLKTMFPSAKITNVYASTEAGTLFASDGEIFRVKDELTHLVRIRQGLLFVHKRLIGLFDNQQMEGEWYSTGDLVDIVSEDPLTFRFISRSNEMINVGGYKVNPIEIEEAIRNLDGVKDVFVYGKSNRILGGIVCCDIIKKTDSLTELKIRESLKSQLQEFKIPRVITFVDKLEITRTGKMDRKQHKEI